MVVAQELVLNVYSGVTGEYSAPTYVDTIKISKVRLSIEELKEIAKEYFSGFRDPDEIYLDFTGYEGGCSAHFIWRDCKEEGEEYDYEVILDVVSTFCVIGG
jgi:hypothetical protein